MAANVNSGCDPLASGFKNLRILNQIMSILQDTNSLEEVAEVHVCSQPLFCQVQSVKNPFIATVIPAFLGSATAEEGENSNS